MHEMGIAQNIYEHIINEIDDKKLPLIRTVKLKVGALTAIEPESLSFCFESIIMGTLLVDATLDIEIVPVKARCRQCFKEFEVRDYFFFCPYCQNVDVETIAGTDLTIQYLEIEDNENNRIGEKSTSTE